MTAARLSGAQVESLKLEDGREVQLTIRRSPRARRIRLCLDQTEGSVELVLPLKAPLAKGMALVESHRGWLAARLKALPPRLTFKDGTVIPVLGEALRLCHQPDARRGVWREGDQLMVSGDATHFARRVTDWLRRQALRAITTRAHRLAARLNKPITAITIRDPRTRWGSCSADGRLSFSWRLVLAPIEVLDYVVAHEISHLQEMNHSPGFWAVVATLNPHSALARAWLKRHGPALHRCG